MSGSWAWGALLVVPQAPVTGAGAVVDALVLAHVPSEFEVMMLMASELPMVLALVLEVLMLGDPTIDVGGGGARCDFSLFGINECSRSRFACFTDSVASVNALTACTIVR
jgi:hypothetical protein